MRPNPPLSRFEWVVKHYDPSVALYTFGVLAHTVVGDRVANGIVETIAEANENEVAPTVQGILRELRSRSSIATGVPAPRYPEFQQRKETDPLWPWVARELARAVKTATGDEDVERVVPELRPLMRMRWLTQKLKAAANAIALWAKTNRIDLGRVTAKEALAAIEDFETRGSVVEGRVVYRYEDGFTVQELRTEEQLDAEGEAMQHCVGEYHGAVELGDARIFSLRDPKNRPHVTMEYTRRVRSRLYPQRTGAFVQIQGKQNRAPVAKYIPYVEEFIRALPRLGLIRGMEKPDVLGLMLIDRVGKDELRGADLRDIAIHRDLDDAVFDLRGKDMTEVDLRGVNLSDSNLKGVILVRARLDGAFLDGAELAGADLTDASMKEVSANHVSFVNAVLRRATLVKAQLVGANFAGAVLDEAELSRSSVLEARFDGASLLNAKLHELYMPATVDGHGHPLPCTSFRGADLRGAQISALVGRERVTQICPPDFTGARRDGAYIHDVLEAPAAEAPKRRKRRV